MRIDLHALGGKQSCDQCHQETIDNGTPVAVFEPGEYSNTKRIEVDLDCAIDLIHRHQVKDNACMHHIQEHKGKTWDHNEFARAQVLRQMAKRPPREQQLELALRLLWHAHAPERECYIDEESRQLSDDAKEMQTAWRLARQVLSQP